MNFNKLNFKKHFLFIVIGLLSFVQLSISQIVALDNWFNHEAVDHYYWNVTTMGGYSEWGKLFTDNKAQLASLQRPDSAGLANVDVYIIVDPDTTKEVASPNYILSDDITVIEKWVKNGGVLALLANDAGNCEFTHLNQLASKFGMTFKFVNLHVTNALSVSTNLPNHFLFRGVDSIFIKGVSSLKLTDSAKAILTENGNIFMAETTYGKGMVVAITDPWIYNEYINSLDNKKAAQNFTKYLLHDTIVLRSEKVELPQLKIFPNPSKGQIVITTNQEYTNSNIIIRNSNGLIIYNKEFRSFINTEINLSHQPQGIYIIECRTAQNVITSKIIKL